MTPAEFECIYLVSGSASELRLTHAVRTAMTAGLVTFQVQRNPFSIECDKTREQTVIFSGTACIVYECS